MKNILLFITFFLTYLSTGEAQKEDHTWVLGYDKDFFEPSATLGLMEMSFNENNIEISENEIGLFFALTSANICDENGKMLFYTNGMEIAGSNHEIIENGTGLNLGTASDDWTLLGKPLGYRMQQGAIILPDPGKENEYYTFHLWTKGVTNFTLLGTVEKLFYTKVTINSLTNQAIVTEKNIEIHEEQSLFYGHLMAVRHGNGRDWWLIVKGHENNKFISFLISPEGISEPFIQNIGIASKQDAFEGQAVFSTKGDRYFHFSGADGVFIMDYDRCSGIFSNFEHIPSPKPDDLNGRGMSISPNDQFLYLSFPDEIYQLDLKSNDIPASAVLLDTWDGVNPDKCLWATFNQMQLAPNGEIFMSATNTAAFLHVIKNPNKKGKDCDFKQRGIELPSCNNFGLPNFPNFRLFDLPNSFCDTLGIDSTGISANEQIIYPSVKSFIYPNPTDGQAWLNLQERLNKPASILIYDALGKVVLLQELSKGQKVFPLDLDSFSSGMYFYTIEMEGVKIGDGKLVKH